MFWKIVGGIAAFFMVVVLAVALLATVSVAAFGSVVGAVVEELDISTEVVNQGGERASLFHSTKDVNQDLLRPLEREPHRDLRHEAPNCSNEPVRTPYVL